MKILALDSSGPVVTLGVADGRKILAESRFSAGGKTVGLLTPELQKLLRETGLGPSELEGFALGAGPGSFTGLKVGFAAIMGLAFNGGKPIWVFPSLKLTALGLALSAEFKKGLSAVRSREKQPVFQPDSAGMHLDFGQGAGRVSDGKNVSVGRSNSGMNKVLVLTGAKKGYFYRAVFIWTGNEMEEAEAVQAQKIGELAWPGEPVWVTGSALEVERTEVMGRLQPGDRPAAKDFWHPPAGLLAQFAATGKLGKPVEENEVLEPIFLRSFETRFKEIA